GEAVGDQTPDVLSPIEVFLDQGVRCAPRLAGGCQLPEILTCTDNVDRWPILRVPDTIRDVERKAVNLMRPRIFAQLIAEQSEKGNDPIAGDADRRGTFAEPGATVLEHSPESACVGEEGSDFIGETAPGFQAEVGGLLAREVRGP